MDVGRSWVRGNKYVVHNIKNRNAKPFGCFRAVRVNSSSGLNVVFGSVRHLHVNGVTRAPPLSRPGYSIEECCLTSQKRLRRRKSAP